MDKIRLFHSGILLISILLAGCKGKPEIKPNKQGGPNLINEFGNENFQAYRYIDFETLEGIESINKDSLTYPYILRHKTAKDHVPLILFFKEWKYIEYIFHKGENLYYSKKETFSGLGPGSNEILFVYPDSLVMYYLGCIDSACASGFIRSKRMISEKNGYYINYMTMDAGIGYDGYKYSKRNLLKGTFEIDTAGTNITSDLVHSEKSTYKDSANYRIENFTMFEFVDSLNNFTPCKIEINYYNLEEYRHQSLLQWYLINEWCLNIPNSYGPEFSKDILQPY